MKTNTADQILAYITEKKESTPKDIIQHVNLGAPAVFRQIKGLLEKGLIKKIGKSPRVFYVPQKVQPTQTVTLPPDIASIINTEYITFTSQGEKLGGVDGFVFWCQQHNLPIEKTANEYIATIQKYNTFKTDGIIDATDKLRKTFPDSILEKTYYLDFYSIERFGKTKLGSLLLYAKQSQNKGLMNLITEIFRGKILDIITKNQIDAVGFIPPTIPRKIQFLKELEHSLNLYIPRINIVKASGYIPIPQKSLSKIEDRIRNARETIFVDDNRIYKNVLLIDDAVGSGATLNETSAKIRDKKLCTGKIFGLALVGSYKGFEVIQEI